MTEGHAPLLASLTRGLWALALCAPLAASAQNIELPDELQLDGLEANATERAAWTEVETEHYIRARELAEKILARDKSSYLAHLVLAHTYHYAEANLPRALFHLNQAQTLYARKFGDPPRPDQPWRWHAELLRELIDVHGDLEHHEQKLQYIARYNELYDPDMVAERAWPLMKLGKHAEARLAAELGLADERSSQKVTSLNALCAIEFEAGNDGASYDACKRAMDEGPLGRSPTAVDLTNFAEASRSLFKLDEAERVIQQATTAIPSWYGNPWLELGELYVRQGRFAEAHSSLKQVAEYRQRRPAHVRDADRTEQRRALASFLLVSGKPEAALEITGRALHTPDRRAHNSRDPAQDESLLALLDRLARIVSAEQTLELAATEPWYVRPKRWLQAAWKRWEARESAGRVERLLADDGRIVGSFRIGTSSAAVMPPWLVGELVPVLGAGVTHEAVSRARKVDHRPGASAYYDAVDAEAAFHTGDEAEAVRLAERALASLGPSEVLLQARVMALSADAAWQRGDKTKAVARYEAALDRDPGVLRRLQLAIPVEIRASGGGVAEDIADMLASSPRFDAASDGLGLQVKSDRTSAQVCLVGGQAQVLGCSETKAKSAESTDDFGRRAAKDALDQLFRPRIDLSQTDIHSLDGQNLSGRDALESVFD